MSNITASFYGFMFSLYGYRVDFIVTVTLFSETNIELYSLISVFGEKQKNIEIWITVLGQNLSSQIIHFNNMMLNNQKWK